VDKLETAFLAVSTKQADIENSVSINIQALQDNYAADTTVAKTGEVLAKQKELAKQLEEAVTQMQPSLQSGIAAKESILKATSDGILTAKEVTETAAQMGILISGLQSGVTKSKEASQLMIQIMLQFQADVSALKADLARVVRSQGGTSSTTLPNR
jgi:Asp-tRNA(Asn)/Glu-tRNA(Gln) amidotransferase B subunit